MDALAAEERYAYEPADRLSPDKLYDRRWALTLLDQVLARLRQEQSATPGRATVFAELKVFLAAGSGGAAYGEVAARLGLTEGAVKVAVHRLRQRYQTLLTAEIAHTVGSTDEVAEERQHLLAALSA